MIVLIAFFGLIIGLCSIPFFTKSNLPKTEKVVIRLLLIFTALLLILFVFYFNGYHIKGKYTFPIIILIFIGCLVAYYVFIKNTIRKILMVILLIPLLALGIYTLIFSQTLNEFDVNDNTKIIVTSGDPLSCGELIYITKTKFVVFNKEIIYESSLCLRGIEKIETVKFNDEQAEFLIFHDKTIDSENPYRYVVDRKEEL